MRPVNLLPARHRPRSGGGDSRSAYVALGALALLVVAVFGYVITANKVSSRNAEITEARQQIATAQAQSSTLREFGSFAAVKQARLSAVRSLATGRLDWERLFRELAHVLPAGVWLTDFDGRGAPADSSEGTSDASDGPQLLLKGCADNHRKVADVMVRLRELHLAEDVELTNTAAPADEEDSRSSGGTGDSEGGCDRYYSFEITVTLGAQSPGVDDATAAPVPARLGGGS